MSKADREQMERLEGFLREYEELAGRYGICVNSCGCCDGPEPYFFKGGGYEGLEDHMAHLRRRIGFALGEAADL